MKKLYVILALLVCSCRLFAQHGLDNERWKEYLEEIILEREDESGAEELADELHRMADKPVNLNRATADELRRIPFLSDEQIRLIIAHRISYGAMMSIYELKDIKGLDFPTIELLLPFVYVARPYYDSREPSFPTARNIAAQGRHELQLRYDRCLQTKAGYRPLPSDTAAGSPNKRYLGEPFYHSLKYSFSFGDKIQAGMAAEKDAGESFRKGYDFYSFHLLLRNISRLKTLVLGDYRASFGQGLAVGYGSFPVQMLSPVNPERRSSGFTRHGSTGEYGFFRGGALTAALGNLSLSAFYSYRKLDATIADSVATSVKTDGLHRLPRELEKASRLNMQSLGANLNYALRGFSAGMTLVSNSFLNYPLMPQAWLYNLHYFRGHSNMNISLDYRMAHHRLTFYGETAASSNKAIATINALLYTPSGSMRLLVLHRSYDKAYHAFLGNAFGRNSAVQNEQGLYMAACFSPIDRLSLSASADVFALPWPAYGIDFPSEGRDYSLQADYVDPSAASFYVRYRYRRKEKNSRAEVSMPEPVGYSHNRLRIYAKYALQSLRLSFQSSASAVLCEEESLRSRGLMLSHRTDWTPEALPLRISLYAALFDADDYNSRLTTYEKNMQYTYGFSQLYGKGIRLALVARWDVRPGTSLHLKAGDTHYAEGETIGSDLEEIAGRRKTEIKLLLRQLF
ncbi:MAG: helix-hairpin-helix domain-containing protein [Tannerellaceae bacterium]|nr:helix-hairpin-helix domain-containing protein [Tannerellaceae bacterium]